MQSQSMADGRSSDASEGEGRDNGLVGEQILDELERRSIKSGKSGVSGNSGEDVGRQTSEVQGQRVEQSSSVSSEKKSGAKSAATHSSGHRSSVQLPRREIEKLDATLAKQELAKIVDAKDEELQQLEAKLAAEKESKKAKQEENIVLQQAAYDRKIEHQSETKTLKVAKDSILNKLSRVKKETDAIKGQRDELVDTLAGMKARHQVELRKIKQDVESEVQRELSEKLHEIEEKESAEANAEHKANILAEKLQAAEREKVKAQKEADILRVKEAMSKAEVTAKGAKIQAMRAEMSAGQGDLAQSAPNASRLLESVFEAERRLQEEMTELKKKMKGLNAGDAQYQTEMGQLQQQWDSASTRFKMLGTGESTSSFQKTPSAPSSSSYNPAPAPTLNLSSTRGTRNYWSRPMLAPITETDDPSNDGSGIAPSGHFSSNADEGVGDLHDFDDAVENPLALLKKASLPEHQKVKLEVEVDKVKKQKDALAEDLERKKWEKELLKKKAEMLEDREMALQMEAAEQLAADASKIARLQYALSNRREEQEEKDDIILELKQELGVKEVTTEVASDRLNTVWAKAEAKEEDLKKIRTELEEQKGQKWNLEVYLQGLRDQLDLAWEAKRIAEMRCEDYRVSRDAQDERHEKELERLRHEIRILKRSHVSNTDGEEADLTAEVLALRKDVKRLEEEKNILENMMEWKEVKYQSTIEELEQQLAAQTAQLKQDINRDKGDLLSKLDKQADDLKQRLASNQYPSTSTSACEHASMTGASKTEELVHANPIPLSSEALEAVAVLSADKLPTGSECNSSKEISEVSGGEVGKLDP